MGKPLKDETGQLFGLWLVLRRAEQNKGTQAAWVVQCACGQVREVAGASLRSGASASCGLCQQRPKKHGMSGSTEYAIWLGMHRRCENQDSPAYKNYGGRGIKVCKSWRKFENFYADMGPRPPGHSIERKNNDKGYSKSNCVWATSEVQNRNRRDSIKIRFKGKTLNLCEWAQELGLSPQTLYYRYAEGYREPELLFSKGNLLCLRRHRGEAKDAYRIRMLTASPSASSPSTSSPTGPTTTCGTATRSAT